MFIEVLVYVLTRLVSGPSLSIFLWEFLCSSVG
jgi:hypothetical protein